MPADEVMKPHSPCELGMCRVMTKFWAIKRVADSKRAVIVGTNRVSCAARAGSRREYACGVKTAVPM